MKANPKVNYSMTSSEARKLADQIENGSSLALAPDYSGCAMSVIVELIQLQRKNLTLIGVPQLGLQADMLIGSGCVREIDAAAVTLGEFGQAPAFSEAVTNGTIIMRDSTCPVIHAGLQAAEKGIPFMPLRGILGSDLAKYRDDWQSIQNPFASDDETDPILLAPAINPDITLFHAPKADEAGNVWVGIRRELMLMAHASRRTLVSVEERVPGNFLDDAEIAAGTIPSLYITDIEVVKNGASPVGLFGCYGADMELIEFYLDAAKKHQPITPFIRKLQNG